MSQPQALIAISSHCVHCPAMLHNLTEAVKKGLLAQLNIINIEQKPDFATELGIRSVPWTRIGQFELSGAHTADELALWIERASTTTGAAEYLTHLLEDQQLQKASDLCLSQHDYRVALIDLFSDLETPMAVRIGVGAIFEDLASSEHMPDLIDALAQTTQHQDSQVRADACYYLGLSQLPQAIPHLQHCLGDSNHEVVEIAQEALEDMGK